MPIAAKLVDVALAEWARWGHSVDPLRGRQTIVGLESKMPYLTYVTDYWKVVGHPTWNGNTPQPWSAAFISFCFDRAGAGKGFPYNEGHAGYCGAIIRDPAMYSALKFSDPSTTKPTVGDLVFAGRSGTSCPSPPSSYKKAVAELSKPDGWFCSHSDIVVAVRSDEIDVIGGNVKDSVTMTTYATAGGHINDPRRLWLGILQNSL